MKTRSYFKLGLLAIPLVAVILGGILIIMGLQSPQPTSLPQPQLSNNEATSSAIVVEKGSGYVVKRVIDGDTIELENGQKVRYIGIDTPETVDPRRSVGCFGKEASLENKKIVEGKSIRLAKDVSEIDKFGRLLRYAFVASQSGELFINDYLVRQGFARAVTYPPDMEFSQQFKEAEAEARDNKRGLWGECPLS